MSGQLNSRSSKSSGSYNSSGDLSRQFQISSTQIQLDKMTWVGLISAILIVLISMFSGGEMRLFVDIPSIVIVFGGTIAVVMIGTSSKDLSSLPVVLKWSLFERKSNVQQVAKKMIMISELARRKGYLALEGYVSQVKNDLYLKKILSLLSDNLPIKELEFILETEMASVSYRHSKGIDIIRQAAEVAPAMGLIGTLVGLVQMLGKLDDPSSIGPAMAVALITTFYGAILGTMILGPLANKLEHNSKEEIMVMKLKYLGALSISKQENPRRLELMYNTVLPGDQKIKYFD